MNHESNCSDFRPLRPDEYIVSRRHFLERTGMGLGALGLGSILSQAQAADAVKPVADAPYNPLAPRVAHFPAKAKHIIHIFASGGPSQVDTWDPKPELAKFADKTLPGLNGLSFPSPFTFEKQGKSGIEVSELFPKLGKHVDKMSIIRSMWTDIPAHDIAQRFMNTGAAQQPRPSLGSWAVYGLGTENQNLPGFITLGGNKEHRQASFLPGAFEGVNVNYSARLPLDEVLHNIRNRYVSTAHQQRQLDLAKQLNELHSERLQRDTQLEARIQAFEMAFRMQTEATDAFNIQKESDATKALYGAPASDMGSKLLVARRLVERGVRFVQVQHGGWDTHQGIEDRLSTKCNEIDGPASGLLADLEARGLLNETLVLWGGEFGRTVTRDRNGGDSPGRDHNGRGFCCWMAGGGVKGGHVHGSTDDFGARAVTDKVHVHDLHATILALLGFDHTKLTYRYNGRDFRLTDNYGQVVKQVIG